MLKLMVMPLIINLVCLNDIVVLGEDRERWVTIN